MTKLAAPVKKRSQEMDGNVQRSCKVAQSVASGAYRGGEQATRCDLIDAGKRERLGG